LILNAGPYNNGTTHVVFEPLDFLARLAALVPRPRVNLTRYHGVFAPNSPHCALVTRAGQGKCCEWALAKSLVYCCEAFDDAKIGMAAAYATGDYTM
jgi:hypothetical protein